MSVPESFYFYDLETSGRDPRWHRILQFAGVRTDADLNVQGEPLVLRGRLPEEVLPEVEAMIVTGLTPAIVTEGLGEGELAAALWQATGNLRDCLIGYNSIRFDDEFLRYTYYRALMPPYERERHGGARFDLLDLVRAARALRPQGVHWPNDDEGLPSARLGVLAAANGVEHLSAHDAASDVLATIGLAQRLKSAQPRLFEYAMSLRQRRPVEKLLEPGGEPVVHVSGRIPRDRLCLALVTSLSKHPRNTRGYIVFDLSEDPRPLERLDEDELHRRIYTPTEQLDVERLRVKEVRSNRSPFVAALSALRTADAERLHIDVDECVARHRWLRAHPEFVRRLVRAFSREYTPGDRQPPDADAALYDGFIGDKDQTLAERLRADVGNAAPAPFDDERLNVLWQRYRARNAPETLDANANAAWRTWIAARLNGGVGDAVTLAHFADGLRLARERDGESELLNAWTAYAGELATRHALPWPPTST